MQTVHYFSLVHFCIVQTLHYFGRLHIRKCCFLQRLSGCEHPRQSSKHEALKRRYFRLLPVSLLLLPEGNALGLWVGIRKPDFGDSTTLSAWGQFGHLPLCREKGAGASGFTSGALPVTSGWAGVKNVLSIDRCLIEALG